MDNPEQYSLLTRLNLENPMSRKVILDLPHLAHTYVLCENGIVTNVDSLKVLRNTSINEQNRYVKVHLDKFYPLHRLVAQHFVPNPDNLPQVNHIDGNRYNNAASNLEWCTASENVQHSYDTGLACNKGESNSQSKLTEEDVINVWRLRNTELTARQIRDRLNLDFVGVATIKSIRQGKSWSSITSKL